MTKSDCETDDRGNLVFVITSVAVSVYNRLGLPRGGKLPSWAWPGGYPISYLDAENNVLCPDCSNQNSEFNPAIVEFGIVEQDEDEVECFECSAVIGGEDE